MQVTSGLQFKSGLLLQFEAPPSSINYLMVAGGGAGGWSASYGGGGGGGAGGFITGSISKIGRAHV